MLSTSKEQPKVHDTSLPSYPPQRAQRLQTKHFVNSGLVQFKISTKTSIKGEYGETRKRTAPLLALQFQKRELDDSTCWLQSQQVNRYLLCQKHHSANQTQLSFSSRSRIFLYGAKKMFELCSGPSRRMACTLLEKKADFFG